MKKYEKESLTSYTLGAFPTFELLKKHGEQITKIWLRPNLKITDEIQSMINLAKERGIEILTNEKVFNVLSPKDNCFVIGEFSKFFGKLTNQNQVVLVNPSDMGNMGTIMRSMLGFGIANLAIIKPAVDVFNPKVIRASMGAIFSLNIEYFENFEDYAKKNKQTRYLFYLDGKTILQDIEKVQTPFALVFGNEASGLPDNLKQYGETVVIKHSQNIDSLNLPISASIALYDFASKL